MAQLKQYNHVLTYATRHWGRSVSLWDTRLFHCKSVTIMVPHRNNDIIVPSFNYMAYANDVLSILYWFYFDR